MLRTVPGFVVPYAKHLARRVEAPRGCATRFVREGDRLRTRAPNWLMRRFEKRIVLDREGYATQTWKGKGFAIPLADMQGFFALPYFVPGRLVTWLSVAVLRHNGEDVRNEIFTHKRDEAEYFASVFNEHLLRLKAELDPYRE